MPYGCIRTAADDSLAGLHLNCVGREAVRFHYPEDQPISRYDDQLPDNHQPHRHRCQPLVRPAETEVQSGQRECCKRNDHPQLLKQSLFGLGLLVFQSPLQQLRIMFDEIDEKKVQNPDIKIRKSQPCQKRREPADSNRVASTVTVTARRCWARRFRLIQIGFRIRPSACLRFSTSRVLSTDVRKPALQFSRQIGLGCCDVNRPGSGFVP
jgi:hypothetical protein